MRPLRVLHVASEVAPYSKVGGLGDVLGALPAALDRSGVETLVVSPRYRSADPARFELARRLRTVRVPVGGQDIELGLFEARLGTSRARLVLLDHPMYDRPGIYGEHGHDYGDNAWRFAALGRAALAVAAELDFWPDVLHGHDWQAGPALLFARSRWPWGRPGERAAQLLEERPPKTVFTIHNLAYQGLYGEGVIDEVGLPRQHFHPEGMEYWGQVNLMKAGITMADRVTTVSPRYAREIQTPELGQGLDGLLRLRAGRLTGILNGVDDQVWNPERDVLLAAQYSADELAGKRACKAALQRELGLPVRPSVALFGSVSRLVEQKGFDLVAEALETLLERDIQYAVLGAGDPELEARLQTLAKRHPGKLAVRVAQDERLAHLVESGADCFVMPSRFEPCGLGQLYALRYGTPPIVHATGGLDDTVVEHDGRSATGTGFKFEAPQAPDLTRAWLRALHTFGRPDEFAALQRRGMAQDHSWAHVARAYADVYRHA